MSTPSTAETREAVAGVARQIQADVGTPDVIVNNAGAGRHLFFEETEPDEFETMLAAPFYAAVYVTRAFLPGMLERGSGYILGVNAPIAYAAWQGAAGYAISRWALRGLLEVLRADLRGTGVVVGQVVVGKVASDYWEHNPGSEEALPRLARSDESLDPGRGGGDDCARDRAREASVVQTALASSDDRSQQTVSPLCRVGNSHHREDET